MIEVRLKAALHEMNLLREAVTLFGQDEGWHDVDIEWANSYIQQHIDWLSRLLYVIEKSGEENNDE